jgi:hypothetical protein
MSAAESALQPTVNLHLAYEVHEGDARALSLDVRDQHIPDAVISEAMAQAPLQDDEVHRLEPERAGHAMVHTILFSGEVGRNRGLLFALNLAQALGNGAVRLHFDKRGEEGNVFSYATTEYRPVYPL